MNIDKGLGNGNWIRLTVTLDKRSFRVLLDSFSLALNSFKSQFLLKFHIFEYFPNVSSFYI